MILFMYGPNHTKEYLENALIALFFSLKRTRVLRVSIIKSSPQPPPSPPLTLHF